MDLSGVLPLLKELPQYRRLLATLAVEEGAAGQRHSLSPAAKPFLLAGIQAEVGGAVLVLVAEAHHARRLNESLAAWSGQPERALLFPGHGGLFYERVAADPATNQQRLSALSALAAGGAGRPATVVVADVRSAMQRLPAPSDLVDRRIVVRRGQRFGLRRLLEQLVELGYERATSVVEPGAFANRGGIVDVFPPAAEQPFRLEFFGDEIESIRVFDPLSQRSQYSVEELPVTPPRELTPRLATRLAQALAAVDLGNLAPEVAERWQGDRLALSRGDVSSFLEQYLPFIGEASLLDYLHAGSLVVVDEPERLAHSAEVLAEEAERLYDDLQGRGELPRGLPRPYFSWPEVAAHLAGRRQIIWAGGGGEADDAVVWPFQGVPSYGARLDLALDDCLALLRQGERVLLTTHQADRLTELLAEREVVVTPRETVAEVPPRGGIAVVRGTLAEGWRADPLQLVVLSDAEVFGWAKPRPVARRRRSVPAVLLSDLAIGDYVVHVDHGIGLYHGVTRLTVDGVERDYLVLEYAAGDRMFVPTDQADKVSRYRGAGEEPPTLHRLGTQDWARAKERVKASARDIAKELLEIYASRQLAPGHRYASDSPWQAELEASFPYAETPDQLQAVAEVKADMESAKPMDRLICGDVGYGKTEVALRAAFKAVVEGKQVAVLVPTTVLAQQHYATFRERLQAFPVRVEVLSRFRRPREQRAVVAGLAAGTIDICIGTHRLLQKDVSFKDLGLLIIDEEHRFGVAHKEQLKKLRRDVDVLTLSATPIPRTLYMSLAGVRDMSTIATPPEERLPIKTFLSEYRDATVREAILRELDRGGQVFFVHNRVQGIERVAAMVARLVPEAKVAVAHGQMREDQLERVMLDFADGRYDVLVCTTIIESGLDLPNVNTIVVHQAERFGLAQLYQLRGRVGRSASRAYAYLLFSRQRRLSPVAERRLRTVFEASELGAGFQIALQDLEIRGAGNLLGAEQHGHIAAVGFDLYCRLLAEAVEDLRGKAPVARRGPAVSVDLPLAAYLPPDYVPDDATRLNLYQRLAAAADEEEVGRLALEIKDRFGAPPAEALNLLFLVQLKATAARAGVQSIAAEGQRIVVRLNDEAQPDRARLVRRLGRAVELTPHQVRLDRRRLGGGWQAALQEVVALCAAGPAVASRA